MGTQHTTTQQDINQIIAKEISQQSDDCAIVSARLARDLQQHGELVMQLDANTWIWKYNRGTRLYECNALLYVARARKFNLYESTGDDTLVVDISDMPKTARIND